MPSVRFDLYGISHLLIIQVCTSSRRHRRDHDTLGDE